MIGFFGGTFDPIHNGHINLAIELQEYAGLDEVWFCPSHINPLKQKYPEMASGQDRFNMAALAIEGIPGFKVIDQEIRKKTPSYTIDTLRELKKKYDVPFRLLMGGDQIEIFNQWKESEEIEKIAPLLIGQRGDAQGKNCVKIPLMEISATTVRERLKNRLPCPHLVPCKVLDYIYKNHLYLSG